VLFEEKNTLEVEAHFFPKGLCVFFGCEMRALTKKKYRNSEQYYMGSP